MNARQLIEYEVQKFDLSKLEAVTRHELADCIITDNGDGTIDVKGNIDSAHLNLLPKIRRLYGHFYCSSLVLKSLEGSPRWVEGSFICYKTKLPTLNGGPEWVGDYFTCSGNRLTTLEGAPQYVGGALYAYDNKLISLRGAPTYVGGDIDLNGNPGITAADIQRYKIQLEMNKE